MGLALGLLVVISASWGKTSVRAWMVEEDVGSIFYVMWLVLGFY